ncbi:pentatricopeptide repeat-containing protein [Tanacetum coccineum]
MCTKCGVIEDSRIVFDGMRRRNMVTWTSIITGYARNGLGEEAINLFRVMKRRKIYVNKLTMVSLIRACGTIKALQTGKELHAIVLKNHIDDNIYIVSTLVWLYYKCGDYSSANYVLERMSFRDVVSWTAMISGSGFYEMVMVVVRDCGEGSEVDWWRRLEKVVVGRRRHGETLESKDQIVDQLEETIEDLISDLEIKGDELNTLTEMIRDLEVEIRLANQKLRVTEHVLNGTENKHINTNEIVGGFEDTNCKKDEKIIELENTILLKEEGILDLGEDKREAISGLELF